MANSFESKLWKMKDGESLKDPSIAPLRFRRRSGGVYAEFRYKDSVTGKWRRIPIARLSTPGYRDAEGWHTQEPGALLLMNVHSRALELQRKLASGVDLASEAGEAGFTLKQALELHDKRLRAARRSERTIDGYRDNIERYMADWLHSPLRKLTRTMVRQRHEKITKTAGKRKGQTGTYAANAAMRALRAVWNTARREDERLGESPTIAVAWHRERPRRVDLLPEGLADWYKAINTLSPVQRDYALLVLFTGLRRTSASTLRWADVDLDAKTLRIPRPKGGGARAFTLPLSDYLIDLLKARKMAAGKSPWVFPSPTSRSGHLEEPKSQKREGKARKRVAPSPHALRHTYIHVATHYVSVPLLDVKLLTNHALPRDVTLNYTSADDPGLIEKLRPSQQKIADYLKEAMQARLALPAPKAA